MFHLYAPKTHQATLEEEWGGTTTRQTLEKSAQGFLSAHTGAGRGTIVGAAYIAGAGNCEKRDDCENAIILDRWGEGLTGFHCKARPREKKNKNCGNESVQTAET